jgi:hypothetical protein
MKKNGLMIAIACIILSAFPEASAYASPFNEGQTTRQERKEMRALRKANRKSLRYKGTQAATAKEQKRITREQYRQRKKMDRAARRQHKTKWGSNEMGDVFQVY